MLAFKGKQAFNFFAEQHVARVILFSLETIKSRGRVASTAASF
jgi:hypothetical protein